MTELPPVGEPEAVLATKRCVPSVLTMSGSSTPWTWTLVPVNEGEEVDETEDWGVAVPASVTVEVDSRFAFMVTRPPTNIIGPPMKDDPP